MSGFLVRMLVGWRLFSAKGERLEELVTKGTLLGFRLWRIEKRQGAIWGLCTEDGFEALSLIAQELGIEVVSLGQGGLPFRWKQIKARPFLLVGLATAFALVFYVSSRIWAVHVTAVDLSPKQSLELTQVAQRAGLSIGAIRNNIRIPEVRRKVLAELPQYSWIGIHLRGMVGVIDGIRLVERPPNHLPSKLIATKTGKVTAVYVFMGASEIEVGQQARRGQVLISGQVSEVSANQPKDAKVPVEQRVITPAEGEVLADVTYQVKRFQSYTIKRQVRTGQHFIEQFLQIEGGTVFKIPQWHPTSFPRYQVQKLVRTLHFAGVALPIQRIDLVYNETVTHKERLSRRLLVRLARAEALRQMMETAPKNSKPVRSGVQVSFSKNGVWVTLTWVVNENIAIPPE